MEKHVSISMWNDGLCVTIWRGENMKVYDNVTPETQKRLTMFCWMKNINPTPHFSSKSCWFDYPEL